MNDLTTESASTEGHSPREAQRNLVATYFARVDDLVRAAHQTPGAAVELPVDWAKRELELASTRLYANEEEFVEEMEEILREVRERIATAFGPGLTRAR